MSLRINGLMRPEEAVMLNGLQLAYLGDSVWETIIRHHMVKKKMNVNHMHKETVKLVNAGSQAGFLSLIYDMLSETEKDIVRRGRNAHPRHTIPKNQEPENYAASTGFEALIGYLYLIGSDDRIREIYQIISGDVENG